MEDDPHNQVSVVDYDSSWVTTYEQQRDAIVAALNVVGPQVSLVEHVGSTAVPGLAAKPIIDIMICYEQLPALDTISPALAMIGYTHVPKPEFTESYFFRHGDTFEGSIHLHITTLASQFGQQMLRFRDALRGSPSLAADYAVFKRQLAEQFPHDRPSYTAAKGPFVTRATAHPE